MLKNKIIIRGAKVNNLKNIDLDIPKTKWWLLPACLVRASPL